MLHLLSKYAVNFMRYYAVSCISHLAVNYVSLYSKFCLIMLKYLCLISFNLCLTLL